MSINDSNMEMKRVLPCLREVRQGRNLPHMICSQMTLKSSNSCAGIELELPEAVILLYADVSVCVCVFFCFCFFFVCVCVCVCV